VSEAKTQEFVNRLIAVASERHGLRWPPGIARRQVEAELTARGYRVVQDVRQRWFAERVESSSEGRNP